MVWNITKKWVALHAPSYTDTNLPVLACPSPGPRKVTDLPAPNKVTDLPAPNKPHRVLQSLGVQSLSSTQSPDTPRITLITPSSTQRFAHAQGQASTGARTPGFKNTSPMACKEMMMRGGSPSRPARLTSVYEQRPPTQPAASIGRCGGLRAAVAAASPAAALAQLVLQARPQRRQKLRQAHRTACRQRVTALAVAVQPRQQRQQRVRGEGQVQAPARVHTACTCTHTHARTHARTRPHACAGTNTTHNTHKHNKRTHKVSVNGFRPCETMRLCWMLSRIFAPGGWGTGSRPRHPHPCPMRTCAERAPDLLTQIQTAQKSGAAAQDAVRCVLELRSS